MKISRSNKENRSVGVEFNRSSVEKKNIIANRCTYDAERKHSKKLNKNENYKVDCTKLHFFHDGNGTLFVCLEN